MLNSCPPLLFSAGRTYALKAFPVTTFIRPYSSVVKKFNTWIKLPVIQKLVESELKKAQQNKTRLPFENTAIWYVQHSFETSLSVLDAFVALGAKPAHIGVIDKEYSRCQGIQEEILKRKINYKSGSPPAMLGGFKYSFIRDASQAMLAFMKNLDRVERIIAVSHGQNFLELLPSEIIEKYPIIGIEKTTAGLMESNVEGLPFPVINMAGCAAKVILESPIIADELIKKVMPFVPLADKKITCGIVGYGNIGKALAHQLLSMGHNVIVYDHDPNKLKNISTKATTELAALLSFSDYIFGCTGRDITKAVDIFNFCNKEKTLISCSSGDNEFLSLLQFIQKQHNGKVNRSPLANIEYVNSAGANIRILRGGFPINFDGVSEASSPEAIQLTRALSLASVLYASKLFQFPEIVNHGGIIKLSPEIQKFIAQKFLDCQPESYYSKEIINSFNNENWIAEHSGGADAETATQKSKMKAAYY